MPEYVAEAVARGRLPGSSRPSPFSGLDWAVEVIRDDAGPDTGYPVTVGLEFLKLEPGDDGAAASAPGGGLRLRRTTVASLVLIDDPDTPVLGDLVADLQSGDPAVAAQWRITVRCSPTFPDGVRLYEWPLWAQPGSLTWDPLPGLAAPGLRVPITATDRLAALDGVAHGLSLGNRLLLHRTLADLLTLAAPLRTFVAVDVWPGFPSMDRPEDGVTDGVTGAPDVMLGAPPSLITEHWRVGWEVPTTAGGLLDELLRALDLFVCLDPWVSGGAIDEDPPAGYAALSGEPRWMVYPRRMHGLGLDGRLVPYTGQLLLMAQARMPSRAIEVVTSRWIDGGRDAGATLPPRRARVPLPPTDQTFQPDDRPTPPTQVTQLEVPLPGGVTLDPRLFDAGVGTWQSWRETAGATVLFSPAGAEMVAGDVLSQWVGNLSGPTAGGADDVRVRVEVALDSPGLFSRVRVRLLASGDTPITGASWWLDSAGAWQNTVQSLSVTFVTFGDWDWLDVISESIPAGDYQVWIDLVGPTSGTEVFQWAEVAFTDAGGAAITGVVSGAGAASIGESVIGKTPVLWGDPQHAGSVGGQPQIWTARVAADVDGVVLPDEEHARLAWHAVYRAGVRAPTPTVRAVLDNVATLCDRLYGLGDESGRADLELLGWVPASLVIDPVRGTSDAFAVSPADITYPLPDESFVLGGFGPDLDVWWGDPDGQEIMELGGLGPSVEINP